MTKILPKKKIDKIIKNYFLFFSKKRLENLDSMFASNIKLIDWSASVKNKKNVLKFNKKIFTKFKKIKISVKEKFYNFKKNSVTCKLTIELDKKKINVIDLIYINSKNKITKIEAYLR